MKKDTQQFYKMDYSYDVVVDDGEEIESSTLITNRDSLKKLNEQITEILNQNDEDDFFQINYPESQDLEKVPFNHIKFQDDPEEEVEMDNSLGIGCWITIIILTLIVISILGLALLGLKQII
ncbi:hypothetical protein LNTAR_19222 [Lentisphaera araneosa HTCC2155]|uniref:Uncharacterized protein n=1 Tax=Lentisphaera araneosa HTCC2155 TaxID=313628 RepID=A6DQR0_9BACT|nr:hypothetical protein [Lentisphaera araneosa]EDM25960.1 hypothetical protein LNTAR_19222 [Lentisphaera araneosa HTCC2155]